MQREGVAETVLPFLLFLRGNPARGVAPCGLQAIACDPPAAGRELGSFFLLDFAFIRPKSQYVNG